MSAFIVISTCERLNWLVDGIEKCRPRNPQTESYVATGKISKRENGTLYYEHNYIVNADASKEVDSEASALSDLLANQFAQFRKATLIGSQLQIFVLDNPIDVESFECSKLVYDSLFKAIDEQHATNCQITRILFSYDVENPCDVIKQVPSSVIRWHLQSAQSHDGAVQICYIDNQDRNGAAIATSKTSHHIMMPRMMADFMMLMSSDSSSYNIRNNIQSDLGVFSLGYSECMYYFEDVKRYYELAYEYDIRKRILEDINQEESLDYEHKPLGLYERVDRLSAIYKDVPFDQSIEDYPKSLDKKIDDIIRSLRSYIVKFREKKIEEAISKDDEQTKLAQQKAQQEGDADWASIIVTRNLESAKQHYPDYIDREQILSYWKINSGPNGKFEDDTECQNRCEQYKKLITLVQCQDFKQHLNTTFTHVNTVKVVEEEKTERSGCNPIGWFFRKKPSTIVAPPTPPMSSSAILEEILSIADMQREKEQYRSMYKKSLSLQEEINRRKSELDNFVLTTHCSSYSSLIDMARLKAYQKKNSNLHINNVVNAWRTQNNGTFDLLLSEAKKECDKEVFAYRYIKWDEPFEFVKTDIDLTQVAKELDRRSLPLVNTVTARPELEDLTNKMYYTDCTRWKDLFLNGIFTVTHGSTIEKSSHIESKIIKFQALQWDEPILEGLTDIFVDSTLQIERQKEDGQHSTSPSETNLDDGIIDVEYEEVKDDETGMKEDKNEEPSEEFWGDE